MTIEKTVDIQIPSTPEDRKKIKDSIGEMVDSLQRQSGEIELRKEIADNLKEDFGLDKAVVNKMAKLIYADTFDAECRKQEEFESAFETLFLVNEDS